MKHISFLLPGEPTDLPVLIVPFAFHSEIPFETLENIKKSEHIDAVEWRIDALAEEVFADDDKLAGIVAQVKSMGKPVLATVRTTAEKGGDFDTETRKYADAVLRIAAHADAVDVELSRPDAKNLIKTLQDREIPTIVSKHIWDHTPNQDHLIQMFRDIAADGADVAKIAVMPQTIDDVLTLLSATAAADKELNIPVIGIAMGKLGQMSRVYGHLFGSSASFVTEGRVSAPGQIPAKLLSELLRH